MAHRAPIIIALYSRDWKCEFRKEEQRLLSALPNGIFIEHIGSTAVPGLSAKPIIDIMLGTGTLEIIDTLIPILFTLGYEYMPRNEVQIPERRFFAKPFIRPRRFHLHAVVAEGCFWKEHLIFRDCLRNDPGLMRQYAALKQQLAQQYYDNRDSYTNAKTDFICNVINRRTCSINQPFN